MLKLKVKCATEHLLFISHFKDYNYISHFLIIFINRKYFKCQKHISSQKVTYKSARKESTDNSFVQ